jgi:membrane fusion protein, multidrug efflux system
MIIEKQQATAPARPKALEEASGAQLRLLFCFEGPNLKKFLRSTLIALLVAGTGAGGYLVYHRALRARQQPAQAKEQSVPVTVALANQTNFPVLLSGLGTVQAFNTVTVRSRVDGEIIKIAFKEGDIVRPGDQLAKIDPRPFQAALDQAIAKKAQDEATLANSKLDLQRYQTLAKQDFATRQQLDTQQATVAQQTALIAADEAAVENAQTQLDYTNIKAPIGGRVGFRLADQGNIVTAASQNGIVTIAQLQPISVLFTLPETEINSVSEAMKRGDVAATAFTADGSRQLAQGRLAVINNQVDVTTGVIQLKATFDNSDNALWPGQSVSMKVLVGTLQNVVVIPQSAVQHGQQGLWTFVVNDKQRAETRPIEVGNSNSDSAVVTKGLSAGERIVTAGQYRLQNGALVAINSGPPTQQASVTQ